MWSWGMDASGHIDLHGCGNGSGFVRVVVCVQDEVADSSSMPENYKAQVSKSLGQLCDHLHLVPSRVRCCIISDSDFFPGILQPSTRIGGISSRPAVFRRTLSTFTSTAIDILPILCDVADYCLVVLAKSSMVVYDKNAIVPTSEPTSEKSSVTILSSEKSSMTMLCMESTQSSLAPPAVMGKRQRHRIATATKLSDLPGPTCLIMIFSSLALKADEQAFFVDVANGIGLKKLRHEEAVLSANVSESMDGVNLCGAFLHIWALAVSHGSYSFVKSTVATMRRMAGLVRLDIIVRGLLFVCRIKHEKILHRKFVPPYVSLPEEVMELFLTDLALMPITPRVDESAVARVSGRSVLDKVTHYKVKVSELEIGMEYRRVLCKAMRLDIHTGDHIDNFILRLPASRTAFRAPSQELCALHLSELAGEIDRIVARGHFEDLSGFESLVPLESIALRIQMFCLFFLQKINGRRGEVQMIGPGEDGLLMHGARRSAFEAYTAAVERQGHFMDLAGEFLCERSDVHDYNEMSKDVDKYKVGNKHLERASTNEGTCMVEIVSASNLANLDAWSGGRSDPYCSVEVKDKPETRTRTPPIMNDLNPVWNYYAEVLGYEFGDVLLFQVWDRDSMKNDEFLGSAELESAEFHSHSFTGDLELTNPKSPARGGRFALASGWGSLHVKVHAGNGCESMATTYALIPRPTSLKDILWGNSEACDKLNRIMHHIIKCSNLDAAESHFNGAARLHRSRLTPFWELAENCLRLGVCDKLETVLSEQLTPVQRGQQDSVVHEILGAAASCEQFDYYNVSTSHLVTSATTEIVCDSFLIMKVVLNRIVQMDQLIVHSMDSTWKHLRRLPLVTIKVSLAAEGESPYRYMKITLAHSKIIAILESTPGWVQAFQLLQEVPAICRTLNIEDPDVHPSMWCLSLAQLKHLAKIAEEELGPEAYKTAHMYDIVQRIIKPSTAASHMSWARMVNWQSLRHIDVFVSHAWKENFQTFVTSVDNALSQRLRAEEVNLWICSFALFQSNDKSQVAEQIGTDVLDAPFDRALRRCKEVLVVRNAEVDNFQRAWCVYEIFRARQLHLKITIAGPNVFESGSVDILTCKASRAADEQNIKSTIKDADLVDELNSVVTEIKQKGWQDEDKPPLHYVTREATASRRQVLI